MTRGAFRGKMRKNLPCGRLPGRHMEKMEKKDLRAFVRAKKRAMTPAQVEGLLSEHAAMAAMIASMSAQVTQMAQMLREMVTLTHAQEAALKAAINDRARALCGKYGMPVCCARSIAARIRQAVASPSGVRALRDIPRCEYAQALETAQDYDRPGMLRRMAREVTQDADAGN